MLRNPVKNQLQYPQKKQTNQKNKKPNLQISIPHKQWAAKQQKKKKKKKKTQIKYPYLRNSGQQQKKKTQIKAATATVEPWNSNRL
jgi:hypothetical protein